MTPTKIFPLVALIALMGCGTEAAKRSAYEAVQNMGQMECRKNPTARCDKGESYDQYQKERQKTLGD